MHHGRHSLKKRHKQLWRPLDWRLPFLPLSPWPLPCLPLPRPLPAGVGTCKASASSDLSHATQRACQDFCSRGCDSLACRRVCPSDIVGHANCQLVLPGLLLLWVLVHGTEDSHQALDAACRPRPAVPFSRTQAGMASSCVAHPSSNCDGGRDSWDPPLTGSDSQTREQHSRSRTSCFVRAPLHHPLADLQTKMMLLLVGLQLEP